MKTEDYIWDYRNPYEWMKRVRTSSLPPLIICCVPWLIPSCIEHMFSRLSKASASPLGDEQDDALSIASINAAAIWFSWPIEVFILPLASLLAPRVISPEAPSISCPIFKIARPIEGFTKRLF